MSKFYYGIWMVGNDDGNFLGNVYKEGGRWFFEYRFRYYVDRKAHDSQDVKNWYKFAGKDDSAGELDRMLACVTEVVAACQTQYGSKADFVDLQCDEKDPKFFFELASREWAHVRMEEAS